MMQAIAEGREMTGAELRTNTVLRKEEWVLFDEAVTEEAALRLQAVADLKAAGLTRQVANSLGKTVLEYQKSTDIEPAIVSLDGMVRSENDRPEFSLAGIPLPITHKDWTLNLRTLTASRSRGGEALDTMMTRLAGRKVAEISEQMLLNGGKTFGGYSIYGYTNHPNRNTINFEATGDAWHNTAKTGAQILADVFTGIAALQADNMFGPYVIYTPQAAALKLGEDYKSATSGTILQRILELPQIQSVRPLDYLAPGQIIFVQMTPDVVQWVEGEPLQTVQWDIQGGFGIEFKAFQIEVPLIRADADGRSGIAHMTVAE
jgi:hypothetical protein